MYKQRKINMHEDQYILHLVAISLKTSLPCGNSIIFNLSVWRSYLS